MRIYMQIPATGERAPRFYHLFVQQDLLDGWTLVREWGSQGASGRVVREHFDSRDAAETALMRWRDTQLERGYRIVFTKGEECPR